ncbi:MAG TPA: TrkA family potassium uptake protein [Longimicrobiales bacterium]
MAERAGYAVIGLGLFGSAIARTLARMGHEVLAIDRSLPLVESIGPAVAEAVQADATDRAALEALGVARRAVVFNTIGDLSASILCTLVLREIGVQRIIAKINSPEQGRILTRLGAEATLFPERDMGERIALQVSAASSAITTKIELARDASLLEIVTPRGLAGRSLAEADVRRRYGVTVVAVKRRPAGAKVPAEVLVSPPAELRIGAHDLILVAGRNEDLLRLQEAER